MAHLSIADIGEHDLVKRLLSDPVWPSDMFEIHGMRSGTQKKPRISLATAPGKFRGDVDLLLCAPDHPEEAVAIEVKRIKFGMSALRPGGKPNKLGEYNMAVAQANRLADVGFWQVYLYVIIVVDAREQNAGGISYEGLSSKLKGVVESVVTPQGVNARIGLCDLDFTQTMDYAPLTVGTHTFHLQRPATAVPQTEQVTQWVAKIFSAE